MLIDNTTVRVNPSFRPSEDKLPALQNNSDADRSRQISLPASVCISKHKYLMLEPRLKRYQIVKRLVE
ncbi:MULTISPECIES: hypothetical protein [unclassified Neisseria]|uniref:hypothetical protein n=1 Tax=unclassified Neisseria TaxID=2623750 RepID=UPI00266707A3|nr:MULTISPECIES: hypothetical protein [unclassified Neisseria]MDO1510227.1 hypothetical protein [Neisseria sp. MVDL19-042950]MDO1516396.1 hypothetical protein [Neisseria sp. MVDL18-041461]MDO1563544.1 hypothetical protein [Neisseria sp. MVDL20-010259]